MIIASVIWYKSHPHLLDRLLCSLVGRVDGVVMLDGPFKDLDTEQHSPQDNYDVFPRYEPLIDMVIIRGPKDPYPSEAHKRTTAARVAKDFWPDADRLLVIDNDEALISDIPEGVPLAASLRQEGLLTARMVRVYPLTPTITWGPNHGHVQDGTQIYWDGRDRPGRLGDSTWPGDADYQFDILHTPADKRIQFEYEQYNGYYRPAIEDG